MTSWVRRCFPHCCPRHIKRSYCGSPLYLEVHCNREAFGLPTRAPWNDLSVRAFGRFRPAERPGYTIGSEIPHNTVLQSLQSVHKPWGEWIGSRIFSISTEVGVFVLRPRLNS